MRLNEISPAEGAEAAAKRVGRGTGSGRGKTCGRGHKGQGSRAGGYHKTGFEGGQMPLQRRLPKFGFTSRKARFSAEVRLHELSKVQGEVVDLLGLKAAGVVAEQVRQVKVIASGKLAGPVVLRGIKATAAARAAIETAGGRVED